MLKVEFRAMGCQMAAFLDEESAPAAQALQQVPLWFEEWEQALSRFRPDSELSCLNAVAASGSSQARGIPVSPVFWEVLSASLEAADWSGGLISPGILPWLEAAGYDRSFDRLATQAISTQPGGPATVLRSPALDGWREIRLDPARRAVSLPPGMRLDFGGIAKGWAAHEAMRRLSAIAPALMDAGGDIAVSGPLSNGSPWPVDVAEPLVEQDRLDQLALGECGVATSGVDFRRWMKSGKPQHHIIDPRAGEPAQTDLLTVTIVAPTVLRAETAAKVVMILGSQAGLEWLEAQPDLAGLLALHNGQVIYSSAMYACLWR